MPITVFLADDHVVVRQGLKSLLEREGFRIVGEASEGHAAVQQVANLKPDIAVLDVSMPLMNGIDAAREIGRVSTKTRTILLTKFDEEQYVSAALRAGVRGYVLKTQVATDLCHAILQVNQGKSYLSPGVSQVVVNGFLGQSGSSEDPLSPRERQVLQLIGEGKSTKEVAALLGISVKTAESHRTRLMQKLDIHETATLVRYAIRRGLIQA